MRPAPLVLALAACAAPGLAAPQTVLDQEQRLIDIHVLLLDLPPLQSPAALAPGALDLSLELVGIPPIDGTTGSKTQLTASDHTRLFPRPRLLYGLPAPAGSRAFVGVSWIPPLEIREVSTNAFAAEAGFGLMPGAFRIAARFHAVAARSVAPVTDPATRDVLESFSWGSDVALGVRLELTEVALEPYLGAGLVALHGRFTVTSDGNVLESTHSGPALQAGLRVLFRSRWEAVTEVDGYPGRLVHVNVRLGIVLGG